MTTRQRLIDEIKFPEGNVLDLMVKYIESHLNGVITVSDMLGLAFSVMHNPQAAIDTAHGDLKLIEIAELLLQK